jgi:hypothetical protein
VGGSIDRPVVGPGSVFALDHEERATDRAGQLGRPDSPRGTQGQFARLLHLGANTISRWESGRNVQTEAMEMFLRLIRDLPGSLDYLRRHAAA